ncbi:asparagine-linked glycosylation protein [Saxophila tyrrhenica]|uniref:GDP-Man:Man(3)GlcNAc(2)-PP-Dol alpha-1,2-mannosyltransferase n=1 Tax=Saxophila tyrrhenica TaxID=1690608 RepID=A0AAV9PCJ6_9PEZI|nr:asparagine-linked glycosylation protein [Saxophila tyrrhenica]
MALLTTLLAILAGTSLFVGLLPYAVWFVGRLVGTSLYSKTQQRRELLLNRAKNDAKEQTEKTSVTQSQKASSSTSLDEEWEKVNKTPPGSPPQGKASQSVDESYSGIIGFFHPFCNAGGGGERVLFAAILATQQRYPNALCVVYTGDHDASKEQILTNVRNRFNIDLKPARISFLYLSTREYVLASRWPHFTLLGQSLGSLIMGWDAFGLLVPDIFIDTMGYAFTIALCKWLFPWMPTGAYVHYPTISTDMLSSLHDEVGNRGLNAGLGKGTKGKAKQVYWELFARLYSWVGGQVDVVMTNSTWTQRHISSLWTRSRTKSGKTHDISVVYPPCAVAELQEKIPVSSPRSNTLLYIAQFRPEKMHHVILDAFAALLKQWTPAQGSKPKLILVGSVRDDDDQKRVYKLRLQAQEIRENVEFVINAKWPQILELLKSCSVGVNGMWNEHFGIGVVEYQAAGLISVVNNSGGPREDIVVDVDGKPTGFLASTTTEFTDGFAKALSLSTEDALAMRHRARKGSLRFSEYVFSTAWTTQLERLVELGRRS